MEIDGEGIPWEGSDPHLEIGRKMLEMAEEAKRKSEAYQLERETAPRGHPWIDYLAVVEKADDLPGFISKLQDIYRYTIEPGREFLLMIPWGVTIHKIMPTGDGRFLIHYQESCPPDIRKTRDAELGRSFYDSMGHVVSHTPSYVYDPRFLELTGHLEPNQANH